MEGQELAIKCKPTLDFFSRALKALSCLEWCFDRICDGFRALQERLLPNKIWEECCVEAFRISVWRHMNHASFQEHWDSRQWPTLWEFVSDRKQSKMLELCAQNRNPEVNTDDLKDRVTSISRCQSFTFSLADALELHGTWWKNKENLDVRGWIQRSERCRIMSDKERKWWRVELSTKD